MKDPKVSIIVPVYNVEKYFTRCMDSIFAQTFTDFEILLIDDGSTDNSGKMCDDYIQKDERIRVIHQKNGGLANARRTGVNNSSPSAEYIFFVDSDDELPSDGLELAYKKITSLDLDILITTERLLNTQNKIIKHPKYDISGYLSQENFIIEMLVGSVFLMAAHGKIIKKSLILESHAMEMDDSMLRNQDLLMNLKLACFAEKIYVDNSIACYHYRLRNDGGGHRKLGVDYWRRFFKHGEDILNQKYPLSQYPEIRKAFLCMELERVFRLKWDEKNLPFKQNLIAELKSMKGLRHHYRKLLWIIQYPKFEFPIKVVYRIRKFIVYHQ